MIVCVAGGRLTIVVVNLISELGVEVCHRGDATGCFVADFDEDFRSEGEEDVDTRTEFDEPEVILD